MPILILAVVMILECTTPVQRVIKHQQAGDEAYRENNYRKAEEEYKSAIAEAEHIQPNDVMLIISLRSLAQLYADQNRMAEAEAVYKRRVALAETILQRDPDYRVTVLDDLATLYVLESKSLEARQIYEQAIRLTQQTYGENDPRTAQKMDYYSDLLRAKGYERDALAMQSRADKIRDHLRELDSKMKKAQ